MYIKDMRRLAALVLLFLIAASCAGYRPTLIEGPPVNRGAGLGPNLERRMVCREVGRLPCDNSVCKGAGFDLVTFQCGDQKVTRCERDKGGC